MDIVMHSYTFRAYPLEEAFRNAKRFGWDGIELQPCHFDPARIETELPAAIALGGQYDVPIRCVDFGGDFISGEPAAVEASVRQMERSIEACGRHGIRLMNGGVGSLVVDRTDYGKNGSAIAEDVHYERAAEAFRHLGGFAAERDVCLVFEIHMNSIHDTFASTVRLLDLIGLENVMANPDPGNMFATSTAEKDPGALDLLAGRIGYFHFKNCAHTGGEYNYSVRLREGHIDTSQWLAKLVAMGFAGPVCIEYCGQGDPHVAAEEDIRYVRKTLERMAA